jgi:hypothetical protein
MALTGVNFLNTVNLNRKSILIGIFIEFPKKDERYYAKFLASFSVHLVSKFVLSIKEGSLFHYGSTYINLQHQ